MRRLTAPPARPPAQVSSLAWKNPEKKNSTAKANQFLLLCHSGGAQVGHHKTLPLCFCPLTAFHCCLSLPFHCHSTTLFVCPSTAFHCPSTALSLPFCCLSTALPLPFTVFPLPFHCPFTAFHCLSTALPLPFLELSLNGAGRAQTAECWRVLLAVAQEQRRLPGPGA